MRLHIRAAVATEREHAMTLTENMSWDTRGAPVPVPPATTGETTEEDVDISAVFWLDLARQTRATRCWLDLECGARGLRGPEPTGATGRLATCCAIIAIPPCSLGVFGGRGKMRQASGGNSRIEAKRFKKAKRSQRPRGACAKTAGTMMNPHMEMPTVQGEGAEERRDSYLRHSELLVDADNAEDPVERMLIVCRLLFSFCCDILRTSDQVTDVPIPTLGYHHIARKELGACPGGNLRLHLQEICTFSSQTQAAALSHQKGVVRTTMTVALRPWARTKGMVLPGKGSVQIQLEGGAVVQLDRYREEYTMTFPSLVVHSPLTDDSLADFSGQAGITCLESGLEAKINFKANHAVKGVVQQLNSKGSTMEVLLPDSMKTKVLHQLSGRWDKRITITNRNPEKPPLIEDQPGSLLFDAHQDQGNGCYINKRIDLGVSFHATSHTKRGPALSTTDLKLLCPPQIAAPWSLAAAKALEHFPRRSHVHRSGQVGQHVHCEEGGG